MLKSSGKKIELNKNISNDNLNIYEISFEMEERIYDYANKVQLSCRGEDLGHLYFEEEGFEKIQILGGKIHQTEYSKSSSDKQDILQFFLKSLKTKYSKDPILPIKQDLWRKEMNWEQMKIEGLVEIPRDCYINDRAQ